MSRYMSKNYGNYNYGDYSGANNSEKESRDDFPNMMNLLKIIYLFIIYIKIK